jgi:DNA-binding transcriptional LysR family regulator
VGLLKIKKRKLTFPDKINMKYDLKDIILFIHVARLRSFVKAAELLGTSKAVASSRISELEKVLKLSLLTRTTREVNLTSDGQIFLDHCISISEKIEQLDNFIENYQGVNGVLKLVIPAYFSRYHIVPYLEEFLQKYPNLKLDILLTENPVNIIAEGHDLQIRIQVPEDEDLEVAKLTTNHKVVCASPKYVSQYGSPKNPRDLLQHNCLVFGENSKWQFKHKISRKIIELSDISGKIKCDNGEIIKELVLLGIGITLKSSRDIDDEIKSGKLVILLPDYEVINKTQFYAVYPAAKYMSPKIKVFIKFFQDKLYSQV